MNENSSQDHSSPVTKQSFKNLKSLKLRTFTKVNKHISKNYSWNFVEIGRKKGMALKTSRKFVRKKNISMTWLKIAIFSFHPLNVYFFSFEKLNSLSICTFTDWKKKKKSKKNQEILSTFSFNQDSIKSILENISYPYLLELAF